MHVRLEEATKRPRGRATSEVLEVPYGRRVTPLADSGGLGRRGGGGLRERGRGEVPTLMEATSVEEIR